LLLVEEVAAVTMGAVEQMMEVVVVVVNLQIVVRARVTSSSEGVLGYNPPL
jgi:hypothetical protein